MDVMPKKVAVILVNWNSYDLTNDCINSLNKTSYKDFDIIVVDNNSKDHSADKLKETHPDIILLKNKTNSGFTGGNNTGFTYSLQHNYTYSLLLNNDTFVEKDFLSVMVDYMDEYADTGVVQSKIFFNHNRKMLWNGGSYYSRWLGMTYVKGYFSKSGPSICNEIKEIDWATGCSFLARNSVLKQTGLLINKMFIYYEDVELSFRIREAGYKIIYHPGSIVYHITGMANKNKIKSKEGYSNPIIYYLSQRNLIWVLKEYTPWYFVPTVIIFNFFHTLAFMTYFTLRGRFGKLKAVVTGVIDGFMNSTKYQQA
jgi:GT2 family glycosyltransferase